MKNVIYGGLAAVVVAFGLTISQQSHAQASLDVDVDIDVGEIVILYSYTAIEVDVPASELGSLLDTSGCNTFASGACDLAGTAISATEDGTGNFEADVNTASVGSFADTPNLVLQNAWAVRGIVADGNQIQVSVALGSSPVSLADSSGDSQIDVTGVSTSNGTFDPPGLSNEEVGDVTLNLDLAGLERAGLHDAGAGNFVYTVQASSI